MLLAIDIGNTNTVFGFFENEKLVASLRIVTVHLRTSDESALMINQFMQVRNLPAPAGVVIATVVPRLAETYRQLAADYFQLEPLWVNPDLKLNISFDYPNPDEIGADRICNSVASYATFGGPTIIVDFGTATTLDVISANGAYLGGIITPGPETAQSALAHHAAQLFKVSFDPPATTIGKSTEAAMKSGSYFGTIGQIDYLIEKISADLDKKPKVIATGGLAAKLSPASRYIERFLPELTLRGLQIIYKLNRE